MPIFVRHWTQVTADECSAGSIPGQRQLGIVVGGTYQFEDVKNRSRRQGIDLISIPLNQMALTSLVSLVTFAQGL